MKKSLQSPTWKRHSLRRSDRELRHKQKISKYWKAKNRRLARKQIKNTKKVFKNVTEHKQQNKTEIIVPSNFSIVANPDDMLEFFDSIYYYAKRDTAIYLEMSNISYISADAILYTISLFDYLEYKLCTCEFFF
jgi:hypothetical protein